MAGSSSSDLSRGVALLVCLFLSLVSAGLAGAQEQGGEVPLTLDRAIGVALANNEDIRESFGRIEASEAGVMASRGAYDLNVFGSGQYGAFDSLSSNNYTATTLTNAARKYGRVDAGMRQHLPTGGSVTLYNTYTHEKRLGINNQARNFDKSYLTIEFAQSLLKDIGDKEIRGAIEKALLAVEDSQESRNLVISQVVLSIVRAYWTLDNARNTVRVAQEVLDLAREVHRREDFRHGQGLSQGVDVERAHQAVKAREYALLQYRRDMAVAQEQLVLLLNDPDHDPASLILPVTVPRDVVTAIPEAQSSIEVAMQNRYELKQLGILLRQLNIDYAVNRNKLLPSLEASIGTTTSNGNDTLRGAENFSDTDDESSWFAGLTFSYPLQNREARGNLAQTRTLQRIAQDRVSKTERSIETDIRNALHNLVLAREGLPVARAARDSAEKTKLGEDKRFELGGVNNSDLLTAQDALGREEMNLHAAVVNYNIALAEYHYACARLLETYHIEVKEDGASIL